MRILLMIRQHMDVAMNANVGLNVWEFPRPNHEVSENGI